jgi:hypothetical protein
MIFQSRSFTQPAADPKDLAMVYRVYFYKGTQYHVAIAYQLPQNKATDASVNKCIEYSLQSLSFGPDASAMTTKWQRGHPPTTQKKQG